MVKDMVSHLKAFLEERGLNESTMLEVNASVTETIGSSVWIGAYEEGIMIGVHDSGRFPKVLEYPFPIERFWRELDAIMEEVQNA